MNRRDFLLSAAAISAAPFVQAQDAPKSVQPAANSPWLEEIALQLQKEFHLPAVWVAANINDNVEAAVVGVRKMGDPTKAGLDDLLTVASISKPMAGLWIATLVDSGRLTYDTTVVEALPELKEVCLPEHLGITLGQLLTHTAGLVRDVSEIPNNLTLDRYSAERLREARVLVSTPAPAGSKGKELYSNNGVTLAVTMAERAAGEPYETAATRLYRDKLGLKSWGVWPMNLQDDGGLPWPHLIKNGAPVPQHPSSIQYQFVRPSGSAHCTIADLVRFGLIGVNASRRHTPILGAEMWSKVMAAQPGTSATLLSFGAHSERARFEHAGSLGTSGSNLFSFPEWHASVALHTNCSGDEVKTRGIQLIQDAVRKRLSRQNPPPPCMIKLMRVSTMDKTWQTEIVPKRTDDKIRVRVDFAISANGKTGDVQFSVQLGEKTIKYDYFRGLQSSNQHSLHYQFDMPKTKAPKVTITLDSLGTAGNTTPEATSFQHTLRLES